MGDDGKERRSARSAFFFPDSRRLIPVLPTFCSFYPILMPSFLRSDFRLSKNNRLLPLLMSSLVVEAQCLTSNVMKGLWN